MALLDEVNRTGSLAVAAARTGLPLSVAERIAEEMKAAGVLVDRGATVAAPAGRAPIEGRLLAMRLDLVDASRAARRLDGLARLLFTRPAAWLWGLLMAAALVSVIVEREKARLMLEDLADTGRADLALFALVFLGLKVVHEFGHAMAYRVFCLRAGLDPGPIRMGVAIFAMTPFPFTDVTGAWRLGSRWQRAAIGAGGLYVETWAIGLLTLYWANAAASPLTTAILQVAVASGVLTLIFNLNPAVRLDGYYILSDLIGRANLSRRASRAALDRVTRLLGGTAPAPDPVDMAYWWLSYLYRWVIFTGVFWIAYRVDPRLALPVGLALAMLLIVRPIMGTIRQVSRRSPRPIRAAAALALLGGLVAALFVPLPDRLRLDGHLLRHETAYLYPSEDAVLIAVPEPDGSVGFESPDLAWAVADARARLAAIEAATRAVQPSGAERAALETDVARLAGTLAELDARAAGLDMSVPASAVWTPLAARTHLGAWMLTAESAPVGAVSRPWAPRARLWIDQARLERSLDLSAPRRLALRMAHDATCAFDADVAEATVEAGLVRLTTAPLDDMPDCAAVAPTGAAVAARLALPDASLWHRLRRAASRTFQDRLPVGPAK
ncbi:MAG: M50 family metallopeptidase [Pseudomonadota bacterium]